MTELQKRLVEAGYPKEEMFHHETDLYIYATSLTKKVIDEYCKENGFNREWHCPIFKDQITGCPMYDCAFQFDMREEI